MFNSLSPMFQFIWGSMFLFIFLYLAFDKRVRALVAHLIKKSVKSIVGFFVVLEEPVPVKGEVLNNRSYKKDYKKDYTR